MVANDVLEPGFHVDSDFQLHFWLILPSWISFEAISPHFTPYRAALQQRTQGYLDVSRLVHTPNVSRILFPLPSSSDDLLVVLLAVIVRRPHQPRALIGRRLHIPHIDHRPAQHARRREHEQLHQQHEAARDR